MTISNPPPPPPPILLRAPIFSTLSASKHSLDASAEPALQTSVPLPTPSQLYGKWHITHSTLPMWRDKRNPSITYSPLPPLSQEASRRHNDNGTLRSNIEVARMDDLVSYQGKSGDSVSTIHGVDVAVGAEPARWKWRGKSLLLKLFTSEWEVLGWGDDDGDDGDGGDGSGGGYDGGVVEDGAERKGGADDETSRDRWLVIYFSKTLATPAGMDILSRGPGGLSEKTVQRIRSAMVNVEDDDVQRLEKQLFKVLQQRD